MSNPSRTPTSAPSTRVRAVLLAACLASTAFGAESLRPRDVDALPATAPTLVEPYGPGPLQFGELRLPKGAGPFPVAMVIHGGCWTKGFATLRNTAPIASALAAKGLATWNIEYRQVGDAGGGWPGTFLDWGAAVDHLRRLGARFPLDLTRVSVVGHSAGAQAALWTSARSRLTANDALGVAEPLEVQSAFALDGPVDLAAWIGPDAETCGHPVVEALMGGSPAQHPERYAQGSPAHVLPLAARQFLIAAEVLKAPEARAHARHAGEHGNPVQVLFIDSGHFEVIAPGHDEWNRVEALILANTVRRATGPATRESGRQQKAQGTAR